MKKQVSQDTKKQIQKFRESGIWLNEAAEFDHAFWLNTEQKERLMPVFEACGIKNRRENRLNFEVLMGNLLEHGHRQAVFVSLHPKHWRKSQYSRAGESTITIINNLHKQGYLGMKKGYQTAKESRYTRIWPTEKLLQYFRELPHGVHYEPVNLVELKDENGNLTYYKDTAKTRQIKTILERANKINKDADIRYRKDNLNASLVAVFTRKFTLYGRLHTRGYRHYQGFAEDERAEIPINGEPVIELDYSGLHPHLLYAKEGIQFSGDPYSIVDDRPAARPFLKQILLRMLNAKDETAAERASNFWLYHNHSERESLKEIGITRARPVIEVFRQAHKKIDHYFCNGSETGLRVMNKDAQIALDVVNHFSKQGIPILGIHDSFIVQERHRDELHRIMKTVYRKHTGGFWVPIK